MKETLLAIAKSPKTWAALALLLTALATLTGTDVRPGLCEAVCPTEGKP